LKIRRVVPNNRRKAFEVRTSRSVYWYPYARLEIGPAEGNPVVSATVDPELGNEGFTYTLASGAGDTVHVDQVLDYNQDPGYLREMLLYRLTIEAQERLAASALSRRELIRRLRTSPAQFYRLLDQTNDRKSVDRMLALLQALDCEVDLVVKDRAG
jgi:hypothetical protein